MVEKLARIVTDKLVENKYIRVSEQEEYIYVMVMVLEKWTAIAAIMLTGLFLHIAIPTAFFLMFLFPIKKRSGGFHADSFGMCLFLSIAVYLVFALILLPVMISNMDVVFIILAISIGLLELIGAVNHPNMNWSKDELTESKNAARIVVLIESMIIVFFSYLGANEAVIVSMSYAVMLSAVLLLLAKILKQEVPNEKET